MVFACRWLKVRQKKAKTRMVSVKQEEKEEKDRAAWRQTVPGAIDAYLQKKDDSHILSQLRLILFNLLVTVKRTKLRPLQHSALLVRLTAPDADGEYRKFGDAHKTLHSVFASANMRLSIRGNANAVAPTDQKVSDTDQFLHLDLYTSLEDVEQLPLEVLEPRLNAVRAHPPNCLSTNAILNSPTSRA